MKHATSLVPLDPLQSARDLRFRGLADVLVVSGHETGSPTDPSLCERLREALPDVPLVIGSGLTAENASSYGAVDGAIVGTSIKRGGEVSAAVDRERVGRVVGAFRAGS